MTAPVGRRGLVARQWPWLLVVAGVVAGILVAFLLDRFRRGSLLAGTAVVLGAWLRALLPDAQAGLLVVRSRIVDVITLVVLGVGLVVLALLVPPGT